MILESMLDRNSMLGGMEAFDIESLVHRFVRFLAFVAQRSPLLAAGNKRRELRPISVEPGSSSLART